MTALPTPPSLTDQQQTFVTKQEVFQDSLYNTFQGEFNSYKSTVNFASIIATNNSKLVNCSNWTAKSYSVGDIVRSVLNKLYYMSLSSFSSTIDPANDIANWRQLYEEQISNLQIIASYDSLQSPEFLKCDGSFFDASTYPLLAQNLVNVLPNISNSDTKISSYIKTGV